MIDFQNIDQILDKNNKAVDLLKLKPLLNKENITIKTKNDLILKGIPLKIFKPQTFVEFKSEFNSKTFIYPVDKIKRTFPSKLYKNEKKQIEKYKKELKKNKICKKRDFFKLKYLNLFNPFTISYFIADLKN